MDYLNNKKEITNFIKLKSSEIGFHDCGIAQVKSLDFNKTFLLEWIKNGFNGSMKYLENNIDKRANPKLIIPEAKSIISLILNYNYNFQQKENIPKIAKYAFAKDYHLVVKEKLNILINEINKKYPNNNRYFVDTAPIFDKAWANLAGVGWIGKNTLLINKKFGSYVFIGEIITSLELEYDNSLENFCGECEECIKACPTKALIKPYKLDATKCISYHTIENKGEIPDEIKKNLNNYIYGCNICQDVCPWNKKLNNTNTEEFIANEEILNFSKEDWANMTEKEFQENFKNSSIIRVGLDKMKKNIQ